MIPSLVVLSPQTAPVANPSLRALRAVRARLPEGRFHIQRRYRGLEPGTSIEPETPRGAPAWTLYVPTSEAPEPRVGLWGRGPRPARRRAVITLSMALEKVCESLERERYPTSNFLLVLDHTAKGWFVGLRALPIFVYQDRMFWVDATTGEMERRNGR